MQEEQIGRLAEQLARSLPQLVGPHPADQRSGSVLLGVRSPDIAVAIDLEVRELLGRAPELSRRLETQESRPSPAELQSELLRLLHEDGQHSAEALWNLLGDEQREKPPSAPKSPFRRLRARFLRDGQVVRSFAALWMSFLTAVPIVIVFFTVWGGVGKSSRPADYSVAGLKIFAIWALSFLPGWLYVRFLGQRAGALWIEFVLNLHRLGWDSAGYLPEPPVNSEFHQEWEDGEGGKHQNASNIYRQKFDAYYGRSVAEDTNRTNFAVRVDTMFPVFLATALLAACWTATLWDTRFATDPSTVWDALKFAFLGSYVFVLQSLVRRFFQSDLRPSAYASAVLRIIVVLLTATALHQLLDGIDPRKECAVMFVVGIFPVIALQALSRLAASVLRVAIPQLTPEYPLNQLDGLNLWYESRLLEEGIEDMQNLATANLIDVILHTRVPVGRLVDWVDQALLYIHLDRSERGWAERRDVKKYAKQADKNALTGDRSGPASDAPESETQTAGGVPGAPTAAETAVSTLPSTPRIDPRVRGSVNERNRAGTATRIALRQIGIRTATDLLKAFPPDEIDPIRGVESASGAGTHRFRKLVPGEVDEGQIRMLARVLDEERGLAAVWNWQDRGVQTHVPVRIPRSTRDSNAAPGVAAPGSGRPGLIKMPPGPARKSSSVTPPHRTTS